MIKNLDRIFSLLTGKQGADNRKVSASKLWDYNFRISRKLCHEWACGPCAMPATPHANAELRLWGLHNETPLDMRRSP